MFKSKLAIFASTGKKLTILGPVMLYAIRSRCTLYWSLSLKSTRKQIAIGQTKSEENAEIWSGKKYHAKILRRPSRSTGAVPRPTTGRHYEITLFAVYVCEAARKTQLSIKVLQSRIQKRIKWKP